MNPNMPKDQSVWNALAMVAFAALFVGAAWCLTDGFRHFRDVFSIGAFDVALLSLAAFRLVRLATYDKILCFAREWFMDRTPEGGTQKPPGGFRRLVAELIECIWCTGLWAALFVVWVYLVSPVGVLLVVVLAVAALGSFLQNVSKLVAMRAEK